MKTIKISKPMTIPQMELLSKLLRSKKINPNNAQTAFNQFMDNKLNRVQASRWINLFLGQIQAAKA